MTPRRKKVTIPLDSGYSVNLDTGMVHTRHAGDHAGNARKTRTVLGVETLLAGRIPKMCQVCYPPELASVTAGSDEPQEGQARRTE